MLQICVEITLLLRSKKGLMVQHTNFLSGLWVMAMLVIVILVTSLTILFAKKMILWMHKEQLNDKSYQGTTWLSILRGCCIHFLNLIAKKMLWHPNTFAESHTHENLNH
jgi:hypothetical protein